MNTSMFGDNNDNNLSFSGSQILSQSQGGFLNTSSLMNENDNMAGESGNRTLLSGQQNDPCLLPCTVKQIKSAPLPGQDESFCIDNREVHNATIVGRIVDIKIESTHSTYIIDDGTGTLEVKVFGMNNNDNNNNNYDNNDNDLSNLEENKKEENTDLSKDNYVRCIGKIKIYQGNRSMTGYNIRKIKDFDEVTYHKLEVMYSHLVNLNPNDAKNILLNYQKQKRLNNNNNNNNNGNNNNNFNRNNQNFGSNNNNAGGVSSTNNNDNLSSMMMDMNVDLRNTLEKSIFVFLQQNESNNTDSSYDGCHVDNIFDSMPNVDRNEIREALEQMSTNGAVYTTVDDEHYRTST